MTGSFDERSWLAVTPTGPHVTPGYTVRHSQGVPRQSPNASTAPVGTMAARHAL